MCALSVFGESILMRTIKSLQLNFLPLIIDENKVDFDYCFYLLASPAITDYLCGQNANTSGSHKRIDPTNFFNIGIKLPPLAQQYEIGKLLSSLDTKIKLNRQINQNLPMPDRSSRVEEVRLAA